MNSKILLVEDDATAVELIREALSDSTFDHELAVASDGEEALAMLQAEMPNLVLLDLNLPKRSGLEVLQVIRQDTSLKALPVIVLTNSKAQEDVLAAYSFHANAYVRKPLGFENLVKVVNATGEFWFEVATLPH